MISVTYTAPDADGLDEENITITHDADSSPDVVMVKVLVTTIFIVLGLRMLGLEIQLLHLTGHKLLLMELARGINM